MSLFPANYNALNTRWADLKKPEPDQKYFDIEDAGAPTPAPPLDEPMMTPPEQPHRPWIVPGRDAI
jgi:hypothetical protein